MGKGIARRMSDNPKTLGNCFIVKPIISIEEALMGQRRLLEAARLKCDDYDSLQPGKFLGT
jgi:hypothetical protein